MMKDMIPVWFITGCSTGFGRELAKLVLARGYRAVVTARDPQKVKDIVAAHSDRALALKLDVTKPKQIAEAVKKAERKFKSIDVLVNNAGYGYLGAMEEVEDKEARAMFEANFWGLCKVTQAVLPGMRKRRNGHIMNISSMAGISGFPGVGFYNATKFAVEGISEALAKEVAPLGIKVTIVEPGPFRTDWAGRSLKISRKKIKDYNETAHANYMRISGYSGKQMGDPVRAAEAMIKVAESSSPPLHLLLGKLAIDSSRSKLAMFLNDLEAWEQTSLSADFPEE